jgi:hypothetical protein
LVRRSSVTALKHCGYFGDPMSNGIDRLWITSLIDSEDITAFDNGQVISQIRQFYAKRL